MTNSLDDNFEQETMAKSKFFGPEFVQNILTGLKMDRILNLYCLCCQASRL